MAVIVKPRAKVVFGLCKTRGLTLIGVQDPRYIILSGNLRMINDARVGEGEVVCIVTAHPDDEAMVC